MYLQRYYLDCLSHASYMVADEATGDAVVIAGKGHETTQTVGEDVFAFDDRLVAREVLEAAP